MDEDQLFLPQHVPVFPLPEVVLFPRTIIPLHIFEPRYRQMMADALEGDRAIAIALLKPGYQELYYTPRAPIHEIIGVGRILESEHLADGNYNLLLRGVGRATIIEETRAHDYRLAHIEALETYCHEDDERVEKLRTDLSAVIGTSPCLDEDMRKNWLRLVQADMDLDVLSDLIGAGAPIEAELKQCLLDEADAFARTTMLLEQLRTLATVARNYWRAQNPANASMN